MNFNGATFIRHLDLCYKHLCQRCVTYAPNNERRLDWYVILKLI